MAIMTVSQLVELVRGVLRETLATVTVQGEITNFRRRDDDRQFFELKDASSRVLCFGLRRQLPASLADGVEVRITGAPSLFVKNGGFYLRVLEVELIGEGALRQAFEATRRRLEAEGLFRPERKRPLPAWPQAIGLVTSRDAAAFTDVIRVLRNRWPFASVTLAGVAVQGVGAARQIVRAIDHFSHADRVDVVIVTRGGGSLEDLQAFNDEIVARAIYACRIPVVVGVGHERDVTIADYVADRRAATPSNAAELSVPDRRDVLRQIDGMVNAVYRRLAGTLTLERRSVAMATERLGSMVRARVHRLDLILQAFGLRTAGFQRLLRDRRRSVDQWAKGSQHRLVRAIRQALIRATSAQQRLQSLSPVAILKRGYSVTRTADGTIVRHRRQVQPGSPIQTTLSSGTLNSTITEVS